MTIVGLMAGLEGFTAGIYTLENYWLYQMMLIKPYGKLHMHGIGILAAILYIDILAYRKMDELDKATKSPAIHFLSTNIVAAKLIMLSGVTMVVTNFFVTYEPGIDAYSWSNGANTAFFIFSRTTCCFGWMIIAFYIFLGWSKMGKNSLGNPLFNTLGKMVFLAYLISPIIMMMVYSN